MKAENTPLLFWTPSDSRDYIQDKIKEAVSDGNFSEQEYRDIVSDSWWLFDQNYQATTRYETNPSDNGNMLKIFKNSFNKRGYISETDAGSMGAAFLFSNDFLSKFNKPDPQVMRIHFSVEDNMSAVDLRTKFKWAQNWLEHLDRQDKIHQVSQSDWTHFEGELAQAGSFLARSKLQPKYVLKEYVNLVELYNSLIFSESKSKNSLIESAARTCRNRLEDV